MQHVPDSSLPVRLVRPGVLARLKAVASRLRRSLGTFRKRVKPHPPVAFPKQKAAIFQNQPHVRKQVPKPVHIPKAPKPVRCHRRLYAYSRFPKSRVQSFLGIHHDPHGSVQSILRPTPVRNAMQSAWESHGDRLNRNSAPSAKHQSVPALARRMVPDSQSVLRGPKPNCGFHLHNA